MNKFSYMISKIAILNRCKVKQIALKSYLYIPTIASTVSLECSNFKGQCIISVHYFILDRAHILEENILVFSKSNKKNYFF